MALPLPGKIICVGRNYAAHARELGNAVPERPLLFAKPVSAVIAPGDPIRLPAASTRVEHEAEIGVVIGRRLRRASRVEAQQGLAGICCANDVTARDLQKLDGYWVRAKGFDSFCPLGPVLPLPGPLDDLRVTCRVNGELRQQGHTADMIFPIDMLIEFISGIMTLEPGDVILTGTPEGVGPLRPGDQVEVEIPGVGRLTNPVIEDTP